MTASSTCSSTNSFSVLSTGVSGISFMLCSSLDCPHGDVADPCVFKRLEVH
ncbi:uncharacterized protein DS421_12g371300 [Arachis hypogaea]|nr:uncharacterized protein DS421_12g371300 [Arachis hypogaea]